MPVCGQALKAQNSNWRSNVKNVLVKLNATSTLRWRVGGAIKIVSEFLPLTSARINHHCLWLTYVGLAIRPTKYENF